MFRLKIRKDVFIHDKLFSNSFRIIFLCEKIKEFLITVYISVFKIKFISCMDRLSRSLTVTGINKLAVSQALTVMGRST